MRHPFSLPILTLSLAAFAAPACLAAPATVANPSACPVALSAAQHGMGTMVAVGPKAPAVPKPDGNRKRVGQSIDLSMTNTRLERIVAAELEVHGTSNKSRVLGINAMTLSSGPTADAVRNVHLVSSVPADESRTRTVSVNNLTSVAWISVIELRYADGSTWHARPGSECRVIPDGVMLLAGK
ncbi:MAG TPA: hypothetical protein VGM02_02175 [Acidobacteriaceae bacterium]|jgi:hypothetical protein